MNESRSSMPGAGRQGAAPLAAVPGLTQGLLRPVIASSVLFMLLAGLGYPLLTTGVAQALMPVQANGSLVMRQGQAVGSAVVGQNFVQAAYFHPRPSVTQGADPADASRTVPSPYNAALSGASNWGPTRQKLVDAVAQRVTAYRAANGLPADAPVPVDAVTASGSGLDPDISVANASLQTARVARLRELPPAAVAQLVKDNTTGRALGLLGEERVNVLQLNLALDALQRGASGATEPRKQ